MIKKKMMQVIDTSLKGNEFNTFVSLNTFKNLSMSFILKICPFKTSRTIKKFETI